MTKRNAWTPDQLLEAWGLRIDGASMGNDCKKFNRSLCAGDRAGMDDELQAVLYIESVPGFGIAKPILKHVHVDFKPARSFKFRKPGDTATRLAILHRFGLVRLIHLPDPVIAETVYLEFLDALIEQTKTRPFVPFHEIVEEVA